MKRFSYLIVFAVLLLAATSAYADAIGYLWHHMPPIINAPARYERAARNASVTYAWQVSYHIMPDSVAYFEVQFANAPPNTINLYTPAAGGGTCDWDMVRIIHGYSFTTTHQDNHEPIYWRVRTVYKDGTRSNWAVSYHLVGDAPGVAPPPTIIYPLIQNHSCSPLVHHEWTAVPGAEYYEVAFAHAPEITVQLFDDCMYDYVRTFCGTSCDLKHDCIHMPIYFLLRAVFPDGSKTNWAISYYFMVQNCLPCSWPQPPVATEKSSWGAIKELYK